MRGYQDRACVRCGVVFRGTIRAQYCSPKCKVYAYRERKDAAKVVDRVLDEAIATGRSAEPTFRETEVLRRGLPFDRVPAGDR